MSNGMSFWIGGQQDAPSDLYIIYEADLATGRKRQLTTGKHAERTKHDSWWPIAAQPLVKPVVWSARAVVNWRSRSVAKSAY